MRIKFLSLIASFFIATVVMTSCLGDGEKYDYSPDAIIHGFALDTIHGVRYAFTIDQLKGEIYNVDSMPLSADTILDRILITTLSTSSRIVSMKTHDGKQDSVINIADSIDLRKYINAPQVGQYLKLTVWAPDMQTKKAYNFSFRVHRQDPDSLNWGNPKGTAPTPIKKGFSNGAFTGRTKAVIQNNTLYVYSKVNDRLVAYKTATSNGKDWSPVANITGLPETSDILLSSLLAFNGKLYIVANNRIYQSSDGVQWAADAALNSNDYQIMTLLGTIQPVANSNANSNSGISAILSTNGGTTYHFAMTNNIATSWTSGEVVPEEFPKSNLSSTIATSQTGMPYLTLMGNSTVPKASEEEEVVKEKIVPWSSYDGLTWVDLSTNSFYCPILEAPSIMSYNKVFYAFGNDFKTFYTSPTGITWKEANKKIYFPRALTARSGDSYSMVIDKENFLWIICSKNVKGESDDVWRGRLNKLGFINQ